MTTKAFVPVGPNSLVSSGGRNYRVTHVMGLGNVLAKDLESGASKRLLVDDLKPAAVGPAADLEHPGVADHPDLEAISDSEWAIAQARMAIIAPLLNDPARTREMVEAAATAAKVHFTTVYEWMRLYTGSMHLSALIPRRSGRKKGLKLIDEALEEIIRSSIEDAYLEDQRRKPSRIVEKVRLRCNTAGIDPPHANTVRKRIRDLPVAATLRRRGQRELARNTLEPVRGSLPDATYPYALLQFDHTHLDIIVVDDVTRQPMLRPWITLGIDAHTRMVVGVHVSMFDPSIYSIGTCLTQAMLPKRELLAKLEVPGDWPVYGRPSIVHFDNAREFRSDALKQACDQYNIEMRFRPIKTPHYGGTIERLMGTVANELSNLPGATFSSPKARKGYDSDKRAALTLGELENYLMDFFVNVYNKRFHHGIGMSPLRKLEIGILGDGDTPGTGLPELPGDPERIRLDFLPFERRTVQTYGIVLDKVHYWDEVLRPFINANDPEDPKHKREFIVRRDPRLISPIYFWDPDVGTYYEIHYRDASRPPTSLWALKEAQQQLAAAGRPDASETDLFEAMARLDKRVESAKSSTKATRRSAHRQGQTRQAHAERARTPEQKVISDGLPAGLGSMDELFATPVERYEQIDIKSGRSRS